MEQICLHHIRLSIPFVKSAPVLNQHFEQIFSSQSKKKLTQNASPNVHLLGKKVIKSIVFLWGWLGQVRLAWVKFVLWPCRINLDLGDLVLTHILRILYTIHWRWCGCGLELIQSGERFEQFAECFHCYSGLEQGKLKAIKIVSLGEKPHSVPLGNERVKTTPFQNRFRAIKSKWIETSPSISDEGTKVLNLILPAVVRRP